MKKILIYPFILLFVISIAFAIDSITCVPSTVAQGGSITCEVDLELGNAERNQAYNVTFWNDTAQSVVVNSCSFSGTTEDTPSPGNVIESCTVPTTWGASTTGVVNLTLTSLGLSTSFQFNVSESAPTQLIVDEFAFKNPILLGQEAGARWTVSKQDTGKAVLGAQCSGDILQLVGGVLVPIAGSTSGFGSLVSKYAGHTLTSFLPSENFLDEATTYTVEVRCDCIPEITGCMDEDGIMIVNRTSKTGLLGVGTSTITIGSWLTVNTVTNDDGSGFKYNDLITICANITNPENRTRQDVNILYNYRCDSGSDSDTNRVVIGEWEEMRGISGNTTQMQCHDFIIPEKEIIELGASICYGATDVEVISETGNLLTTYHTTSAVFNITPTEIHPRIGWVRIDRNTYRAKVNVTDWNVGVRDIETILNPLINKESTPSTLINNFTVRYWNGTAIPYSIKLEVENERFNGGGGIPSVIIYIEDVNTTLNETFNVTVTIEDFGGRQTDALEGIENKTGTFAFSMFLPGQAASPGSIDVTINAKVELGSGPVEGHFICYIEGVRSQSEVRWTNAVTTTSIYEDTKSINVPSGLTGTQSVVCKLGETSFTNLIHTASDTFNAITASIDGGAADNSGKGETQGGTGKKLAEISKDNLLLLVGIIMVIVMLSKREEDNERTIQSNQMIRQNQEDT